MNFELLNVIEDLGVWYVNHIPTYQNKDIPPNATEPAKEYYSHRNEYPVDNMGNRLTDDNRETVVIGIGNKKGFFYEPFKDMVTTYRYDEVTGRNYYKRYLGNDCTGFSQGVIYTLSNGDRGQTGDVNTASDGLFNHNASADKLVQGYDYTDKAMLKLGWEKYYLDGSVWKQKRLYNNEIQIRTLKDAFGYDMSEVGVNFLEPGDLLCTRGTSGIDGHVEFYIGYNYEVINYLSKEDEQNENIRLKSGIKSIELKDKATQGYSTFGWGGVHDTFPIETNYFKFSNNCFNRYIIVISNGNEVAVGDKDSNGNAQRYTVIWRKN